MYKRQLPDGIKHVRFQFGAGTACTFILRLFHVYFFVAYKCMKNTYKSLIFPVSYTHLAVYKRQVSLYHNYSYLVGKNRTFSLNIAHIVPKMNKTLNTMTSFLW